MEENKITVSKLHTAEMLDDELKAMLGASDIKLTLGGLMSLVIINSPYVYGGKVDENSLAQAYALIEHGDMDAIKFHEALQKALDTAFRVFEILVPDDEPTTKKGKTSEITNFAPEWFSDIMSQASQSMPSLTYRQLLYETPLVAVFHLAMSTARRNGAITARPNDMKSAIEQFKELQKKKKEGRK